MTIFMDITHLIAFSGVNIAKNVQLAISNLPRQNYINLGDECVYQGHVLGLQLSSDEYQKIVSLAKL